LPEPDIVTGLRERVKQLFVQACAAADPARALENALADPPLPRPDPGGIYRIVAVGKAAIPMAEHLLGRLGRAPFKAVVVTNAENGRPLRGARVYVAAHPVPDERGARAAGAVEALLAPAKAADRVIALISGGGSALLPAPDAGLTLADKAEVNRILLAGGFDITDMNLVRQQLSRLKGGGMLRCASPAPVTAYILSDVIGDDLRVIASGPTVAPIGNRKAARDLLHARGVWQSLPEAARSVLAQEDAAPVPLPQSHNILIGSNRKSLDAVVKAAGPEAILVNDRLTGDVADAAAKVIAAARMKRPRRPSCLVFGGETTVTLRGTGKGGRNQELALRVAMGMPDLGRSWAFLSGGTDGRDGPTDAAGGVVDAFTTGRILAARGDPGQLLATNDSHTALGLAGDLLRTGPTATNVADVQILLFA
jgi:glycerate 2-kinase